MKKILIFTIITFCYFLSNFELFAQESLIIPIKKPTLNPEIKKQKISINIIKPQKKTCF